MRNTNENKLPRRAFLRGAAGVLGASVLGGGSAIARTVTKPKPGAKLALWFWNGSQFVPAEKIDSESHLDIVRIIIKGYGRGTVRRIDANVSVPTAKAGSVAYQAWTSAPNGPLRSRFSMRVGNSNGLSLSVYDNDMSATDLHLRLSSGSGPKLREGVYVLADAAAKMTGVTLMPGTADKPVVDSSGSGVSFSFVMITIEHA